MRRRISSLIAGFLMLTGMMLPAPQSLDAQTKVPEVICDATCTDTGGGSGGGGCTEGFSYSYGICGNCSFVHCYGGFFCHWDTGREGTRITKTCVGGKFQEYWSNAPCGTC